MAVDIFLKLKPVDGESRDSKHSKEIDVLAWSWGMSQSGTTHIGGGGGSGKVSVQDLSLTKYIDAASTYLQQACCNGQHFDEGILTVRKAGKDPLEYLIITMKQIIVTSVHTGGSGSEDRLTENVSLNFAEVKVKYVEQDPKGGGGTPHDYVWKIAENTGS